MTLIGLLRALVRDSGLSERQKKDAFELIKTLDRQNAFSNVIQQTSVTHECKFEDVLYEKSYSTYQPTYTRRVIYTNRCIICGKRAN